MLYSMSAFRTVACAGRGLKSGLLFDTYVYMRAAWTVEEAK